MLTDASYLTVLSVLASVLHLSAFTFHKVDAVPSVSAWVFGVLDMLSAQLLDQKLGSSLERRERKSWVAVLFWVLLIYYAVSEKNAKLKNAYIRIWNARDPLPSVFSCGVGSSPVSLLGAFFVPWLVFQAGLCCDFDKGESWCCDLVTERCLCPK